jgi:hypothetical protein
MEKKSPYFVVPYDHVKKIRLKDDTYFLRPNRKQEINPFADNMALGVTLDHTFDTWSLDWSFNAFKGICEYLRKNVLEAPKEVRYLLQEMELLVKKVEHSRTMHIMKLWGLDTIDEEDKRDEIGVNFDLLLQNMDMLKEHYVLNMDV